MHTGSSYVKGCTSKIRGPCSREAVILDHGCLPDNVRTVNAPSTSTHQSLNKSYQHPPLSRLLDLQIIQKGPVYQKGTRRKFKSRRRADKQGSAHTALHLFETRLPLKPPAQTAGYPGFPYTQPHDALGPCRAGPKPLGPPPLAAAPVRQGRDDTPRTLAPA